jgi:hypothetical protein
VDQASTLTGKKYFFASGMDDVNEDDLYFMEFARYFEYALQQNGYQRVMDRTEANLVIRAKYAVSDGRSAFQIYQFPIYEHIGGETYTISETTTDSSGKPVTVRRTIHIPSRIEWVGTSHETRTYTLYNRTASLQAIQNPEKKPSAEVKQDQTQEKILWQIHMHSISESPDLRQIMPYLATVAIPYIGKNSGQQRSIDIELNDPAVTALKKKIN